MTSQPLHGTVVAGAAAEGHGILIGWRGHGELSRSRLLELVEAAKIPEDWAPEVKNASVQLTRAVQATGRDIYNAEQVKKKNVKFKGEREWASRWMLVSKSITETPVTGGKFGDIALIATLYDDGDAIELVIDSESSDLADKVRAEFNARSLAERYVAADITKWLGDIISGKMFGVRYGANWYIPKEHRETAIRICEVLWSAWGTSWIRPYLPIATTPQLSLGLGLSLRGDVEEIMVDLMTLRTAAKESGKSDISDKVANSLMSRLRVVGSRMVNHAHILGDDQANACRDAVHDAMIELDGILNNISFDEEWEAINRAIIKSRGNDVPISMLYRNPEPDQSLPGS